MNDDVDRCVVPCETRSNAGSSRTSFRGGDPLVTDFGKGADCKPVAWFFNKCGALALSKERDPKDNAWAWAIDDYKSKASSKALAACRNSGGTQCKVEVAKCSG